VLERKLELINSKNILSCPGGTLMEAAILQHPSHAYMQRAVDVGFKAVEISDGTIEMSAFRRKTAIDAALSAGLVTITEVGKKDPKAQPSMQALAEQARRDLEWGARWVVVEGRESGTCVGPYDDEGNIDLASLEVFAQILGDQIDRVIWEAPLKHQQTVLIDRFGLNVGLGNIPPDRVLALEALRLGLRFETLKPLAKRAKLEAIESAMAHLQEGLIAIEFLDPKHPKKLLVRLRALFDRAGLQEEEVDLLRGIAKQMLRKPSRE
jgi:phosphosulfolactate synthase